VAVKRLIAKKEARKIALRVWANSVKGGLVFITLPFVVFGFYLLKRLFVDTSTLTTLAGVKLGWFI